MANKQIFLISVFLFVLSAVACIAGEKGADFNNLKTYFLNIPVGKDLKEIEKDINLPHPDKTYMGSSSYKDRSFRYYGFRGMMLEIGLKQVSDESSYAKGRFVFNGDFTLIYSGHEYSRCCFDSAKPTVYSGPVRN